MKVIDLNCDMGESFGHYKIGCDEEVINYISSANIACGFHAGDPQVMDYTVKLARDNKVGVGAHPGFNDLQGFGRRKIHMTGEEIVNELIYQIGAIRSFCEANGVGLSHVKPHGALNNMASVDENLARAVAKAIKLTDPNLIYIALAGSKMEQIGREEGLKVAKEAFADRQYNPDGTLVSRQEAGAVLHDKETIIERVVQMASEGVVTAKDGTKLNINPDTICVHGDNPEAVELAASIRHMLQEHGITVKSLGTWFTG
ncbi:LamB/YcsF family protein [Natranaerobius thermophilus]|uniref:5-oxoprolinase subunit A n=1 Tax=Natranaerobius thermophilus (strain ATCC BAA-1301 / DSM 18059 / JW/NM-WN-LF) TaxID=457570 RepID=PXPA_NATTJ|nr:5-oxoprolinase subunit PxpA [Natranaerobius thermophilus]B2A1I6.1 RecName: Full=5-oxoprolinase subunit A; Short=5-OPase subunit A; AltName: Full=5-oxoprolinase (ATP-hydrolyzing) subunit A [Natranaerobius thermophilus JW/NM-WN-LF]ACB84726.1 LamB/YcsF family protein [Natranaerobius thermophilus JW/NM-WN-LF]